MTALGISRKVAYRLIQSGDIIAVKAGKSYIIPASEYRRYIERRTKNGLDHSEE
jgi:excisionase family DNA binding protein